jgi:hypothetical protein
VRLVSALAEPALAIVAIAKLIDSRPLAAIMALARAIPAQKQTRAAVQFSEIMSEVLRYNAKTPKRLQAEQLDKILRVRQRRAMR